MINLIVNQGIGGFVTRRLVLFGLILALWFGWGTMMRAAPNVIQLSDARQTIDGFGICEAFHQARHIMEYPEPARTEILDLLFSKEKGAGVTILRNIIGDGGKWGNSIDGPTPTIQPEEGVWNWDGDKDQIWLMRQATGYGCTNFFSTVWSPPAWMKTSNSVDGGGSLRRDKYAAFADYLSRYIREYQGRFGLTIGAISLQNEPDLVTKYSSCTWTGAEFRDFIRNHLTATFECDRISTKVVLGESTNFTEKHAEETLRDPQTAARLDIVATHAYDEKFAETLPLARQHNKRIWMTEVSYFLKNDPSINDGLKWAKLIHDHLTVSEVNAWFYWWGACYKDDGESLITLDLANRSCATTKRLFTFSNFSRFIRPGFVRLDCAPAPASGVNVSAFRSGNGNSLVVVAINSNDAPQEIEYRLDGCEVTSFTPYRTSATEDLARLEELQTSQSVLKIMLAARSVTSLVASEVKPIAQTN
jgi:glucuronoarabinoxylan endo-1,4-beta-xylanase